ncbi:MAG: hypothetical protein ACK4HD_09065 [Pannonibacter phragmitetus]
MLLLEIEGKKPVQVQDFAPVEKALRSLKSYGPASFAILTKANGAYVQVAGGMQTCIAERRLPGSAGNERACYHQTRVPFDGRQTLMFGSGRLEVEPDELLFIDDVIALFRAFWDDTPYPETVTWRLMRLVECAEESPHEP